MRRLAWSLVLAAAAAIPLASPAWGGEPWGDWANPVSDGQDPGVEAGRGPSDGDGRSGGGSDCVYRRTERSDKLADTLVHPPGEGTFLLRVCNGDEANATYEWVPMAATPRTVAERAARFLRLAPPRIAVNPPLGQDQVVNLATWLWVEGGSWQPQQATASVPGVAATVTAVPVSVRWDMGDGHSVVCDGPGTRYDLSRPAAAQHTDCSYAYRRSSATEPGGAFVVSATLTWRVSWTSTVGAGGALPAEARTAQVPLRVAEVQALN